MERRIRVLIVDDSPMNVEYLSELVRADPRLEVAGSASSGAEALERVASLRPDVVTMDLRMPGMDGFAATREIMETVPTPIVVVTGSYEPDEVHKSFRALEAGALAILRRPAGPGDERHEREVAELLRALRTMAGVPVVRRRPAGRSGAPVAPPVASSSPGTAGSPLPQRVVAIGASTGGPPVVAQILAGLPRRFLAPVLLVQHMAPGFLGGFVDWLSGTSAIPVSLARHDEPLEPGRAYVAPDDLHLGITPGGRTRLSHEEPDGGLRPSVAHLFRSVGAAFGPRAVGVVLTGMGRDGAEELLELRRAGALTLAQDAASSVIHGMPGEAIRLGAATYVLPPEGIVSALGLLGAGKEGME
ncbi:MAG: chemotaxis-specific protein-glutamate methyltransferase CheB [Deltaproteobacteria bacterium]|nr:chemotaxis-specific protein-glutamate methyltransferase CheB [Deltaproteobacteria bacterium]